MTSSMRRHGAQGLGRGSRRRRRCRSASLSVSLGVTDAGDGGVAGRGEGDEASGDAPELSRSSTRPSWSSSLTMVWMCWRDTPRDRAMRGTGVGPAPGGTPGPLASAGSPEAPWARRPGGPARGSGAARRRAPRRRPVSTRQGNCHNDSLLVNSRGASLCGHERRCRHSARRRRCRPAALLLCGPRPQRSHALRDELGAALDAADRDHDVRVVLLSAEGPAFCAGFGSTGRRPGQDAARQASVSGTRSPTSR